MCEPVELIVNTFERTVDRVLAPGMFPRIAEQNQRSFSRRTVVINNVRDPAAARRRAELLLAAGEIDVYHLVEEHRAEALAMAGVTPRELGRIAYYSDFAWVGLHRAECPWVLFWDADVELTSPVNWVDPSIALLARDPRVLVASPSWRPPTAAAEAIETTADFHLGYGFSDQLFLAPTAPFRQPIYSEHCWASLRYPTSHIAATFEQRVDAHMRRRDRLRGTFRHAEYVHPVGSGSAYRPIGWRETLRRRRNRAIVRWLRRFPPHDPRLRVSGSGLNPSLAGDPSGAPQQREESSRS